MFGAFTSFGKLGSLARAIAAAWTPSALWPTGTEPGMWIDPSNLTSQWQDSAGTTQVSTPGTVADSSNPVGLALDLRLGATTLTDPGNHLFQATSTARPMESARVNLLTYTESPTNWGITQATGGTCLVTANYTTAPDGTLTACRVQGSVTVDFGSTATVDIPTSAGWPGLLSKSVWIRSNTGLQQKISLYYLSAPITVDANGWRRYEVAQPPWYQGKLSVGVQKSPYGAFLDTDPTCDISIWHPQLQMGSVATPYQPILTDGSSYSSTGITPWQVYDGTDDGMATATFTAGTLSNAMDCMIAVRRDSPGNAVCGLYESVAEANKVFGIAESGSGSGCVGSGAGTPTVWVDGVQLTGGTAVTRGTLHTALTVGDYHVLEFRGLDLSTWTASGFGLYTSYVLNGAQGGILLFPSSTSTANRDAARTWLGAKVGLTL